MKIIILDKPSERFGEQSEQGKNSSSLKMLKYNYFFLNNGNYMYLVCTIINNFIILSKIYIVLFS